MTIDSKQGELASLIISIIILIIVIVLIVIVCYNWNSSNNTQPLVQTPQATALAGVAMYKNNKGQNKNKFETCGFMKFGSVQCCGKPDGTYCTHNQKLGQCFGGDCDTTCGGGTSQCQCAHDGVDCTYSKIAGTCYAGMCNGYSLFWNPPV
jgi:hypothetical protein